MQLHKSLFLVPLSVTLVPSKCQKARELFCTVRTHLGELKTKFPVDQYYRQALHMGESKVGYLFATTYSQFPVHRMTFIREIINYKSLYYHVKLRRDIVCLLSQLLKGQTNMSFSILHSASRFHEHWRFVLQRLAFLAAFVVYLESESLVTREEVAQILGSRCQFIWVPLFQLALFPSGWSLNILDHSNGKSPPTQCTRQAKTNVPIALS